MKAYGVLLLVVIFHCVDSSFTELYDDRRPLLRIFLDDEPVEIGSLNTTIRAGAAVASDQANIDRFEAQGGKIEYLAPRNPGARLEDLQATGLTATINSEVIKNAKDIGSCAYGNKKPPGFDDLKRIGACAHRGHLLAHMLGGSGKDVRNIVAVTDLVNNPHMKKWETKIRDAWDKNVLSDNCMVQYRATASYTNKHKRPQNVRLTATLLSKTDDFEKVWFDVSILNNPVPTGSIVYEGDVVGDSGGTPLACKNLAPVCKKRRRF